MRALRGRGLVALAGIGLGIALWSVEGVVHGDALFHLGRMRKLDDFGALSLRAVDEFKDGGLHPGYAFPLWHGWLALVAKLGGVDPTSVVLHESSILAPLALVLAFEMGRAVFRSAWLAAGTVLVQVSLIALAPGGGGAYATLELPGTVARQLLVPAVIALFFRFVREPSWQVGATLAAAGLDLAFVHPTYALFVAIPLAGFALARALIAGVDARRSAGGLLAFGAPVLLVFAWLLPIVRETRSHDPAAAERRAGLKQYATDLVVHSPSSYHLAPGVVARTGAIAVAALVLVPLAALAGAAALERVRARRHGARARARAPALRVPALLRPRVAVAVEARRRVRAVRVRARRRRGGARTRRRPAAPARGPGGGHRAAARVPRRLRDEARAGRPGGRHVDRALGRARRARGGHRARALADGALRRRALRAAGAVAVLSVLLFVLPVAVHGFAHWDTRFTSDPSALTPGLVRFLRTDVPKRAVVYADLETSYRISAYAPVYVANGPPAHVADTKANRPDARRADLRRFLRTGTLAIPRSYHAGWLVLRHGERVQPGATLVYRDNRFRVYRL